MVPVVGRPFLFSPPSFHRWPVVPLRIDPRSLKGLLGGARVVGTDDNNCYAPKRLTVLGSGSLRLAQDLRVILQAHWPRRRYGRSRATLRASWSDDPPTQAQAHDKDPIDWQKARRALGQFVSIRRYRVSGVRKGVSSNPDTPCTPVEAPERVDSHWCPFGSVRPPLPSCP